MLGSPQHYQQNILLKQINQKRLDMYHKAAKHGFTDEEVVECSQELDNLLNEYQDMYLFPGVI
ncbi:aspartyl-phosphate phosphatase Spo0E family protein [Jeotgalibacillus proteolyticus]|uniref:Aspartyl-phosphate phosphatase Spo0E family protein n=1 Tax=Jeotgalibacillus proteolyticus TaxID=2082395 RepID=A0A2S5G8P8_9BACL|nr:aspartyl-phosphate phosphatase Spo0E family protein [Jeotgalibacillus proteolyticus]PPA69315.1 aspartyl-phosphate phosphatase Spo0E family protein [Jeotgalibacillus proteolyticus]